MNDSSRRTFLKTASVTAGAAAVAVGLGTTTAQAEPESSAPAHPGSFVAWVKDPAAGTITVLVDHREIDLTDKKLAKKLAQAAARAHRNT